MSATITQDTTSTTINGKDGTAKFAIYNGFYATATTGIEYKTILDMMRIREVNEMTTADTFSIEGTADQEAGRSQIQGEISGIGKKGGPASGPLIPAPQDVGVLMTFSTGCTLSMNVNCPEAECIRLVNQNCRITARILSKAAYVLTWVIM